MNCKICGQDNKKIFNAKILNKYDIEYFHCDNCGFLQTEEPYWLVEAYSESINNSDTGYIIRNIYLSKIITVLISMLFDKKEKFLDYAGGYGVFVRIMRDIGFDFYWDDKYTTNLFAKGFEFNEIDEIEAITTFESFEHFVQPIDEIENLLKISKNIIFSTELLPRKIPKLKDWWYYGLDHGQHISFYSTSTLEYISKKHALYYYSIGNIHIFLEKKISKVKLMFIKLLKVRLYRLFKMQLKSKTMQDYKQIVSRSM